MQFPIPFVVLAFAAAIGAANMAAAEEMRSLKRIPSAGAALKDAPEGAELPDKFERVSRTDVDGAVKDLASDWSKGDISGHVGEGLYDNERLNQNMDIRVPRDAALRVESVRSIHTDGQYIMRSSDGGNRTATTGCWPGWSLAGLRWSRVRRHFG